MPANRQFFDRMKRMLRTCKPEHRDHYLDQWLDCELRATEWDADKWGFAWDWMAKERRELERRAE